jgi:hypothetical protein
MVNLDHGQPSLTLQATHVRSAIPIGTVGPGSTPLSDLEEAPKGHNPHNASRRNEDIAERHVRMDHALADVEAVTTGVPPINLLLPVPNVIFVIAKDVHVGNPVRIIGDMNVRKL